MTLRQSGPLGGTLSAAALGVLVLAVAGCGGGNGGSAAPAPTSVASTPAASTAPTVSSTPASTMTASLEVLDFKLNPVDLTVPAGQISIAVSNSGPTLHNVTIRDDAGSVLGATPDLREGEDAPLMATLEPGTYVLFCSLAGHESLGIRGTLTVTQP